MDSILATSPGQPFLYLNPLVSTISPWEVTPPLEWNLAGSPRQPFLHDTGWDWNLAVQISCSLSPPAGPPASTGGGVVVGAGC